MFKYLQNAFYPDFYRGFYYSILFIAAIISLLYFKRVERTFSWICFLVIVTLICEVTSNYVYFSLHLSKNIIYHFFTPIEYFIYAYIYALFLNKKKWSRILLISVAAFIAVEIMNTLFLQPFKKFPSNIFIVEDLLLVFFSLILFTRIRKMVATKNILVEGVFWFNSAVLCYYSLDILITGLVNLASSSQNFPALIFNLLLLFNAILYLCFSVSIILNARSTRKISDIP